MRSEPVSSPGDQPLRARYAILRGSRAVVCSFLASRLLIIAIIVLSQMVFAPGRFGQPTGVLPVLTNWDGAWYLGIAERGYEFQPGVESNTGFFPLYPMLVRGIAPVFRNTGFAAVVLSNLFLLGAGLLLNTVVRLDFADPIISRTAVSLLMFSPVSYFFSSAYTESTFLLLSLAAFFAASRKQWLVACLCGMALSATRNVGLLIGLPLFIEFVRQTWKRDAGCKSLLTPRILFFALIPLGFLSFMWFTRVAFHDPLAYAHATAVWGRKLVPPWQTIANAKSLPPFHLWVFASLLGAALLLWATGIWLKVRLSHLVWTGLLLATYLCSNSLEAMPRYLSIVFPLFIIMAVLTTRFPGSLETIFAVSVALLTICTALSANGYWMT